MEAERTVIATYCKKKKREQEIEAYDCMTSVQGEKDWSKKKNVRKLSFFLFRNKRQENKRKRKNGLSKEMS